MNSEYAYHKQTKKDSIYHYATWLCSLKESYMPFTTTVVFKSSSYKPNPIKWIDEYNHKFLWKINKQLQKNAKDIVCYADLCWYEFGESSVYKSIKDQRCPHHVHGIILIPNDKVYKIWDHESVRVTDRLSKDFKSISNISSVLVEPIRNNEIQNWMSYITKAKDFYQH